MRASHTIGRSRDAGRGYAGAEIERFAEPLQFFGSKYVDRWSLVINHPTLIEV